jgi:hypothetical protein
MELVLMMAGIVTLALAALVAGTDSRPRIDEEPRRSI